VICSQFNAYPIGARILGLSEASMRAGLIFVRVASCIIETRWLFYGIPRAGRRLADLEAQTGDLKEAPLRSQGNRI
jgi:hypothetical protein